MGALLIFIENEVVDGMGDEGVILMMEAFFCKRRGVVTLRWEGRRAGGQHEDLREGGRLDGVDVHGCGLDLDVAAHLADGLPDDRVEPVLDVVVGSG